MTEATLRAQVDELNAQRRELHSQVRRLRDALDAANATRARLAVLVNARAIVAFQAIDYIDANRDGTPVIHLRGGKAAIEVDGSSMRQLARELGVGPSVVDRVYPATPAPASHRVDLGENYAVSYVVDAPFEGNGVVMDRYRTYEEALAEMNRILEEHRSAGLSEDVSLWTRLEIEK